MMETGGGGNDSFWFFCVGLRAPFFSLRGFFADNLICPFSSFARVKKRKAFTIIHTSLLHQLSSSPP